MADNPLITQGQALGRIANAASRINCSNEAMGVNDIEAFCEIVQALKDVGYYVQRSDDA